MLHGSTIRRTAAAPDAGGVISLWAAGARSVVDAITYTILPMLLKARKCIRYRRVMTSLIGPIPTGQATRILSLTSRAQMDKLIDCGLVPVLQVTAGGQRRVDSAAVLTLAARPYVAARGASADLAVHLGPLQIDTNGVANQRTHHGYYTGAAGQGLTLQQIEDAWAGLWNCSPDQYIGSALVGVVSGFVVAVAQITGYRIVNRRVRFDLGAPLPHALAHYTDRRIAAQPGAPFQAL